jgi:hypothetical protein
VNVAKPCPFTILLFKEMFTTEKIDFSVMFFEAKKSLKLAKSVEEIFKNFILSEKDRVKNPQHLAANHILQKFAPFFPAINGVHREHINSNNTPTT